MDRLGWAYFQHSSFDTTVAFSHLVPERYLQLMTWTSHLVSRPYLETFHIWSWIANDHKDQHRKNYDYTANAAQAHFCQQRPRQLPWRSSPGNGHSALYKNWEPKVSRHVTFTVAASLGKSLGWTGEAENSHHPTETIWNHDSDRDRKRFLASNCIQLFKVRTVKFASPSVVTYGFPRMFPPCWSYPEAERSNK